MGLAYKGSPSLVFLKPPKTDDESYEYSVRLDDTPALQLFDAKGQTRAVLGKTSLTITKTGEERKLPASSLVLFDSAGDLGVPLHLQGPLLQLCSGCPDSLEKGLTTHTWSPPRSEQPRNAGSEKTKRELGWRERVGLRSLASGWMRCKFGYRIRVGPTSRVTTGQIGWKWWCGRLGRLGLVFHQSIPGNMGYKRPLTLGGYYGTYGKGQK